MLIKNLQPLQSTNDYPTQTIKRTPRRKKVEKNRRDIEIGKSTEKNALNWKPNLHSRGGLRDTHLVYINQAPLPMDSSAWRSKCARRLID